SPPGAEATAVEGSEDRPAPSVAPAAAGEAPTPLVLGATATLGADGALEAAGGSVTVGAAGAGGGGAAGVGGAGRGKGRLGGGRGRGGGRGCGGRGSRPREGQSREREVREQARLGHGRLDGRLRRRRIGDRSHELGEEHGRPQEVRADPALGAEYARDQSHVEETGGADAEGAPAQPAAQNLHCTPP